MNALCLSDEQRSFVEENLNLAHGAIKRFEARERLGHFMEYDDIVQTANLALCRAVMRYNKDKGRFSTYAYNTIKNAFIEELRKYTRRNRVKMVELDEELTDTNSAYVDESEIDILRAFAGVTSRQKKNSSADMRFLLLRMEGYSTREIADICGISCDQVARRVRKAKNSLQMDNIFMQEAGFT